MTHARARRLLGAERGRVRNKRNGSARLRRSERIAIIGVGPAGIHLAHLLHQRGFRAVTVLERGDAIAGKVLSVADARKVVAG